MQSTNQDDFISVERGLEHVGYFDALVTLHKDLPVSDNRDI
jgi:hypothetical protein